jgi:hypothetical protein
LSSSIENELRNKSAHSCACSYNGMRHMLFLCCHGLRTLTSCRSSNHETQSMLCTVWFTGTDFMLVTCIGDSRRWQKSILRVKPSTFNKCAWCQYKTMKPAASLSNDSIVTPHSFNHYYSELKNTDTHTPSINLLFYFCFKSLATNYSLAHSLPNNVTKKFLCLSFFLSFSLVFHTALR